MSFVAKRVTNSVDQFRFMSSPRMGQGPQRTPNKIRNFLHLPWDTPMACPVAAGSRRSPRAAADAEHAAAKAALLRLRIAEKRRIQRSTEIIVTARDSWSRMVPPPLRPPGQEQAWSLVQAPAPAPPLRLPMPPAAVLPGGPLSQRASFSSQSVSSTSSPPAG
jgi:hypothetical protein